MLKVTSFQLDYQFIFQRCFVLGTYDYYIVSQKMKVEDDFQTHPYRKASNFAQPSNRQTVQRSKNSKISQKSAYIGLTLKEYFNLAQSKDQLEQIDQESNSSISAGTPNFGYAAELQGKKQSRHLNRRTKLQTEVQQQLGETITALTIKPTHKMATLSHQQLGNLQKITIKLPAIHEQRQRNISRQGIVKQSKPFQKKDIIFKGKSEEPTALNLANYLKNEGKKQKGRNPIHLRKDIRARVTSTSFYHMNIREKERERIKTEEQIADSHLQKSFVITRYGALGNHTKKNKEEGIHLLKKYQNSFKMTKH